MESRKHSESLCCCDLRLKSSMNLTSTGIGSSLGMKEYQLL